MIAAEKCSASERDRTELKVRIAVNFDDLAAFRTQWDEATEALGGTVYMTFDWTRTWWEHYGKGKALRLYIFESGDEVVGIVPVYLESIGIWPLRMKIARFLGANIPPKVFDPPVHRDFAKAVFEKLVRSLLEGESCDLLSFGPVSSENPSWRQLLEASRKWSSSACTSRHVKGVHSVFYLPDSMEEFMIPFGKSRTKYRGRYELRPIKKVHTDVLTDVVSEPSRLEAEFERFSVQHARQWQAEGKPGHFGDWPDGRTYNLALVKTQGALGRMRYTRIRVGERVLASEYVFAFGGCYYWELPARETGNEFDDFRLGTTAALTMIGTAIKEGIKRVEAGMGHYPYKLELGAIEHGTVVFHILKRGLPSRARKWACDIIKYSIACGYRKMWFRRIQPRLPRSFRGHQWRSFLRFDY
ncbi:MAG: hypothetical protein JWM88_1901 [Verrucomicrobia bacterium]|nr:hypothetical protein [Verrucomicrobiota bacterium]